MSTQLSLYWQAADKLEWYWTGDSDVYSGALEELQDQKQNRNLDTCLVRLFLPANWFSTLDIQLPAKMKRASTAALKFAAEEYLAQDIDSVHLVLKETGQAGQVTVEVTERERFQTILQTLGTRKFLVTEAFNAQAFGMSTDNTDDVLLQISNEQVTLNANNQVFNVHTKGFGQWFDLWASQNNVDESSTIRMISDSSEGPAKAMLTEFEAAGFKVQWLVEGTKRLIDWHEQASASKQRGNLITAEFGQRSGQSKARFWVPSLVAGASALMLWSVVTLVTNQQMNQRIDQTWQASEAVFLQVFGKSKRIQRPLMVREMRTMASQSGAENGEGQVNALAFLNELSNAPSTFILEDFRFNKSRSEANFTIIQPTDVEGDAYSLFEALKNDLNSKQFEVEYSANQDKDAFRARFKAVIGGQG